MSKLLVELAPYNEIVSKKDASLHDVFDCAINWHNETGAPLALAAMTLTSCYFSAITGGDTSEMIADEILAFVDSEVASKQLIDAIKNKNPALAIQLINDGADVNAKDQHGMTPLICAAWTGHVDVMQLLIDRGADVNAKDNEGNTVLMLVVRWGYVDVARLLLDKGANVNAKTKARNGYTALDIAKAWKYDNIVELLQQHGAE